MKRVGIITIQSIVNYGNRLQNYAVEQLLRNKNVEVESIRIAEPILWTKIYIKAYTSAFIGGLKNDKECQNRGIRTKKFLAFNEKHLNIKIVRSKKAKKNFKRYDFVFLGGDQLWAQGNKDYGIEGYRFGSLTTPEKRIPFGVSFGTEKILNEYGEVIAPWLKQLQHLAIREKTGADIIEELTGKTATVLLDPVFGLSVEEWDRLSGNTKYIQEDYGCVFFLGECKKEIGNLIEDILKDKKIINVNDYCKNYSQAGPDEFINIIKNAEIVFTDSFHCAAFAIIYNKPFVVFERENWDKGQITRLKNMLELFGLKDRLFTGNKLNWFGMNYEHVNSIIESERKRINQYIDDVVGRKIGD